MKTYRLTYARTVIMEKDLQAESEDDALDLALEWEREGRLPGVYNGKIPAHVRDIADEENIWEVEEIVSA